MQRIRINDRYGTKDIIVCLLLLFLLVFLSVGCGREETISLEDAKVDAEQMERAHSEDSEADSLSEEEIPEKIYVYICGQVLNPGVYEFAAGSRIYEAIEVAGGLLDSAAVSVLNQAEKMEDGQKIYVPSEDEVQEGQEDPGQEMADDGRVNLNLAGEEELMTLPGIGEKKAQAIISYRESHGGFQSTEELMEVEGIKTGIYEKIKDRIKV